jgi:hypothetical protein
MRRHHFLAGAESFAGTAVVDAADNGTQNDFACHPNGTATIEKLGRRTNARKAAETASTLLYIIDDRQRRFLTKTNQLFPEG